MEFRNRYALNVSVSFALIVTLAISLSAGGVPISIKMQSVLFWIILFFSAMSGLSHIFIREEDQGTSLFLRLNAKPGVVLTSKLLFNISLFLFLQILISPLFIFFLQMEIKSISMFIITVLAGGLAISTTTTILASIVAKAGGKGALFTVISFPIVLPLSILSQRQDHISLLSAKELHASLLLVTSNHYLLLEQCWVRHGSFFPFILLHLSQNFILESDWDICFTSDEFPNIIWEVSIVFFMDVDVMAQFYRTAF